MPPLLYGHGWEVRYEMHTWYEIMVCHIAYGETYLASDDVGVVRHVDASGCAPA